MGNSIQAKQERENQNVRQRSSSPPAKGDPRNRQATQRQAKKPTAPVTPYWVNFLIAGTSGVLATCILQPADVVKTRMQLVGNFKFTCQRVTLFKICGELIKKESYSGLYRGMSAAILRQFVYTSGRLGGFNAAQSYHKQIHNNVPPDFPRKITMGCVAGGVGAFFSTPAEVCLVRMMADARLPMRERRNYRNVFNALCRIAHEEGFCTLWRGASSTILRAIIISGAQLATYAQVKERLIGKMGDNLKLHTTASLISGLVATAVSMPVDIVKTRVQYLPERAGQLRMLQHVIICEGYCGLWRGFIPAFFKIGPHTVITFVTLEQLHKLYNYLAS